MFLSSFVCQFVRRRNRARLEDVNDEETASNLRGFHEKRRRHPTPRPPPTPKGGWDKFRRLNRLIFGGDGERAFASN